jgi:HAE1 family hydrophobic/amphiphilic exporter-1
VSNLVIRTDPYKRAAYNRTIEAISKQIVEENQRLAGGRVVEMGEQYIVSGVNMLRSEEDFGNIIVSYKRTEAAADGAAKTAAASGSESMAPIYLKELADISFENERPENIVRINGRRCIGLSVYKEMQHNTVKTVESVVKRFAEIEKALPGYKFDVVSNQGTFINSAIGEVKESAILGVLLAVVVLYLFLRRLKVTLVISLAMPISIIATFNLMFFNDLTLNIMTLGGLALGAGMLVDNAIVVIESIFRNQEKGLSVKEAVIQGAGEVGGAVTASTLTTIVVFLPIVYLHGASGELFKDQAWTVTFSLVSSLFVAILVIPTLYERMFRKNRDKKSVQAVSSVRIDGYSKMLRTILNRRWLVVALSLLLLLGTCCLVPFIGTEFMPKSDNNSFSVEIKLPEGTRLERTASTVESIENLIYAITKDTLCTVYSHIGPGYSSGSDIFSGDNTATMKVIMSPESEFTPDGLMEELIANTTAVEGLELSFLQDRNSLGSLMGSEDAPIVIEVKGEELDEIAGITAQVENSEETFCASPRPRWLEQSTCTPRIST